MRETRSFKAKFPGKCSVCGEEYTIDAWLHYVGDRVAHDYCHAPPQYRDSEDVREAERREPSYRVRGRRNHEKRCGTCHLIHAGECP